MIPSASPAAVPATYTPIYPTAAPAPATNPSTYSTTYPTTFLTTAPDIAPASASAPTTVSVAVPTTIVPVTSGSMYQSDLKKVRDPRDFFKVARVFITSWNDPDELTGRSYAQNAWFVVVKAKTTFSLCLRISAFSERATTNLGVVAHQLAAVVE
ncbi:hypothetical protein AA0116_g13190 [Alternaria tenuissima]|nr:hypothetical protein AA0116_g13190 [Alternaria tenuissima]